LDPVTLADLASSLHPSCEWPSVKVIHHIMEVHHRFVRESLAGLRPLVEQPSAAAADGKGWAAIGQRFAKLQDEFLSGIGYEERVVFPQLLSWEEAGNQRPPSGELRAAVETVERSHARCLHMLWRLLRLIRDETPPRGEGEAHRGVLARLSELCDDYEQQLFEEECLLLPRLKTKPPDRSHSDGEPVDEMK
jgi:iron-sulfur cluster repair protein YtfE (RIC family)